MLRKTSKSLYLALACGVSFLVIAAGASLGSADISFAHTVRIILFRVFAVPLREGISPTEVSIVWLLRLPRALLAFLAGGALAASGAVCQSVLRNPLASPYILGVSSGASLGAALVIVSGFFLLGRFTLPVTGFAFGLASVFFAVFFASRFDKSLSSGTVILCGMVLSLFLNAAFVTLSALFTDDLRQIVLWQMGSFAMRGWNFVVLLLPFLAAGFIGIIRYAKEMDIMTFGDEQAASAGVAASAVRKKLLAFTAVLTGATVALSGVIGFVDLVAPHIARKITGARHIYLLPMSFFTGGSLMVVADLIARTIVSPAELPVGAVTAIIGAPFFAWVYFRRGRRL